jgi:hypothetical protein
MGITRTRAQRHIEEWERKLTGPAYAHRRRWPGRLFHHTPIENAASILNDGVLLSRNDSHEKRKLDIAGAVVIQNRDRAHQFARLYFRPRTPTQFHIEGIRKVGDYYMGDTHAPTLVMLIFDSFEILTREGVRFSDGNMQSYGANDGEDDEFFDTIEFAKVFHEGGIGNDRSIIHCRCAEVLAPSPFAIDSILTSIYCRSEAERITLLNDLSVRARQKWRRLIAVSDDLRVFSKSFTFVEEVSLQKDGVVYRLHPPERSATWQVRVEVWLHAKEDTKIHDQTHTLPAVPGNGKTSWRAPINLKDGLYKVRIWVEGCRAFEAQLILGDYPF